MGNANKSSSTVSTGLVELIGVNPLPTMASRDATPASPERRGGVLAPELVAVIARLNG